MWIDFDIHNEKEKENEKGKMKNRPKDLAQQMKKITIEN